MAKIVGNAVGIPNPQSDWNQSDATKADFIKNKPTVLTEDDVLDLIEEQGGGDGSPGLSAYEVAIKNGFEGSEEEWLLSLNGKGVESMDYYDTMLDGQVGIYVWYTDGTTGQIWIPNLKGEAGADGVGIADIYSTADDTGSQMVVIITLTDGRQLSFGVPYGKDGYTPIKGTDYWTEVDKAEIKSYVDDEIGNYEAAISEIIELQKQFINEITFNLNGTNYTCPKGMTWAELETYDGGAIWQAEGLSVSEEAPFHVMKNGFELTTIDSIAYSTRGTYISDVIRDVSENISYS